MSEDGGQMRICVIGGGLSGSVAILALHRLGLSPIWITSDNHETQLKRWPESISWQGLSLLSEFLDMSEFLRDHIYSQDFDHTCWGSDELLSKTNYRFHNHNRGTQLINKLALTRLLFDHAKEYCQPTTSRVLKIKSTPSTWSIILHNKLALDANCIVFANGRKSSIQRELCSINRVDTLQTHHWILQKRRDYGGFIDTGTLIESCPEGWWYAATMGQESISLTFFCDPAKLSKSHWSSDYLRHHLNQTIHLKSWIQQSQWTQFNRPTIFHTHCQHLTQYADSNSSGLNQMWFSIGDAAIQHDPLSSFGTTNGIWSAIKVAKYIKNQQTNEDPKGITEYNKLMQKLNTSMANKRLELYRNEARFADIPFWDKRTTTQSTT